MQKAGKTVLSIVLVVLVAYFVLGLAGFLPEQYDVVKQSTAAYYISDDVIIETHAPAQSLVNQVIRVNATISTMTGTITLAQLDYLPVGAVEYTVVGMTMVSGDTTNGTWTATIPAQTMTGDLKIRIDVVTSESVNVLTPEYTIQIVTVISGDTTTVFAPTTAQIVYSVGSVVSVIGLIGVVRMPVEGVSSWKRK